jgi:hypothetical protein
MTKIIIAVLFVLSFLGTEQSFASANKKVQKEWTFLLFLNGHNNLDSYGDYNINQMEEIGSTKNLNMVVEWGSQSFGKTRRLYIQKDKDTQVVTSPVVESSERVDMGDYKTLVDFVKWGVKNYPAKHYMVAVWNHGNGWHKLANNSLRDISYDDNTGHKITTEQLGLAMKESADAIGHKVDIYGSDACLMAMAEIAAEMQDSVDFMVGSEDLEPGYGWPYNTWMKRWAAKADATPAEVSKFLTQEYTKAYDGGIYGTQAVTFSAMNLNYLPQLMDSVKNLATSLKALSPADLKATKEASAEAMGYYLPDYKDMGSFIDKLSAAKTNIKETLLSEVKSSVKNVVIENGATGNFVGSQGISFWIPEYSWEFDQYSERYSNLKFNKATDWLSYLETIKNL